MFCFLSAVCFVQLVLSLKIDSNAQTIICFSSSQRLNFQFSTRKKAKKSYTFIFVNFEKLATSHDD